MRDTEGNTREESRGRGPRERALVAPQTDYPNQSNYVHIQFIHLEETSVPRSNDNLGGSHRVAGGHAQFTDLRQWGARQAEETMNTDPGRDLSFIPARLPGVPGCLELAAMARSLSKLVPPHLRTSVSWRAPKASLCSRIVLIDEDLLSLSRCACESWHCASELEGAMESLYVVCGSSRLWRIVETSRHEMCLPANCPVSLVLP